MNLNEPKQISGLIKYQKDSVVSKTLIKKEKGTITIFAFDNGQGLSEHTAPFDALVHIIDGVAKVIISDKSYITKVGEMIILPAGKTHAIKAEEQFKMMLVMIRE
jgi:quercetin dioxygenase-like cupin family protein